VQVGVDERGQGRRALHDRVEREAQLAQHGDVRSEAGGGDHLVDGLQRAAVRAGDDPFRGALQVRRREAGRDLQHAALDEIPHAAAESAALLELVLRAAAEEPVDRGAPYGPEDPGGGLVLGKSREVEQHVEGGVAAADDENPPAGVAAAVSGEHVRDAVEDPVADASFADRGQAGGAQRVGRQVGA
jgi:hypothetical protein